MKSPILGLALSTVAFGASTIYLWTQLNDQRDQADAVRKANAELTARIASLEERRNEFAEHGMGGPGLFGAKMGVAGNGPPPPPGEGPPPDEKRVWGDLRRGPGNMPEMPEAMRKMMRANVRAQNKRMYFDLQSKLGLSDDQTNQMLDLLTEQQTVGFRGPRNRDPEQARENWEQQQAKSKAAITDLLGSSKAAEFEDYQKSMPSRSELMMLSQQLEGVDTPLSDDQRSRMLDALVAERERIPAPAFDEGASQEQMAKTLSDWQADYDKRVADQARSILTAEQFNTYNEYQQWQEQMRQQFAAQGPGGGPPIRMRSGNAAFFVPGPAGGVAFATTTESASSSPTEKQPKSK